MPIHSPASDRDHTASIFNRPFLYIVVCDSALAKSKTVSAWLRATIAAGIVASKIGSFVQNRKQMNRARSAVAAAGTDALQPFECDEAPGHRVQVGTMHLAKDLDPKAAAVMACDNVFPLRVRIQAMGVRSNWRTSIRPSVTSPALGLACLP